MTLFNRLFGRKGKGRPQEPPRGMLDEEQRAEHGAQRATRARMEAEVARDRERRGIAGDSAPTPGD